MSRIPNDVVSGLILMGFALILHLALIPAQVTAAGEGPIALSPRLFCHITAFLLLILSAALLISGIRGMKAGTAQGDKNIPQSAARGLGALVLSGLYIVAMEYLGYFSSTIVFMGLFLWFSGVRSWKGGILFMAVTLPFIYLLFAKALKVILPQGLII